MMKLVLFLVWQAVSVFSQTPGIQPRPPATAPRTAEFVCVPPAMCLTTIVPPTGGTIDIRIVTPTPAPPVTPAPCPAGTVQCFGLVTVPCGVRYLPSGSTADGITYAGAFPWQAYIMNQTSYTGSGVLLDRFTVLTAAHKVNLNQLTPQNIRVIMGVYDPGMQTQVQSSTVARMIIHPNFNATTLRNDIAILRLATPIVLGAVNNIGTVCLPGATQSFIGRNCTVAGWGQTNFNANDAPTRPQKQVTVPIVDYATCRASMSAPTVLGTNVDLYLDPAGELCAGGVASRDACTQDGGSPLSCADPATGNFAVAGLVIWGKGCGTQGVYGAYVDVAKYRAWIDSSVAALNAG